MDISIFLIKCYYACSEFVNINDFALKQHHQNDHVTRSRDALDRKELTPFHCPSSEQTPHRQYTKYMYWSCRLFFSMYFPKKWCLYNADLQKKRLYF